MNDKKRTIEQIEHKIKKLEELKVIPNNFLENGRVQTKKLIYALDILMEYGLDEKHLNKVFFIQGRMDFTCLGKTLIAIKSGSLKTIEEWFFNDNSEKICPENNNLISPVFGAFCKITRKDGLSFNAHFTIETAKKAGLDKRGFAWKSYYQDMLKYKARTRCLNSAFPEFFDEDLNIEDLNTNEIPKSDDTALDFVEKTVEEKPEEVNERQEPEQKTVEEKPLPAEDEQIKKVKELIHNAKWLSLIDQSIEISQKDLDHKLKRNAYRDRIRDLASQALQERKITYQEFEHLKQDNE